ncbi:hypothetical protein BDF21DRAFT_449999 [Thamnidium elegans]|nr:hypothetical protein BDF21DRAFT_449999 [Thamnidium elegans]
MENRKLSKEIIEETKIVEVSYKRRGDPFEPFLIGKKVKCVNPFLYKSYDVTPPPSPKFSSGMAKSSKNVSCFLILLVVDDHISIASTGSSQEEAVNLISQEEEHKETSDLSVLSQKTKALDKELVIKFLKSIFSFERPNQVHKYTFTWVDEITQLEIVKSHFYMESLTAAILETWIRESGIFGNKIKRTLNQNIQFGRYLYLLKQKYRSDTTIF